MITVVNHSGLDAQAYAGEAFESLYKLIGLY